MMIRDRIMETRASDQSKQPQRTSRLEGGTLTGSRANKLRFDKALLNTAEGMTEALIGLSLRQSGCRT
jgi:hypothetical protein